MIKPKDITNFNRNACELEEFLLFCIIVAGKNSHVQAKKLQQFLDIRNPGVSPLRDVLLRWNEGHLMEDLKAAKIGQYNRIFKAFTKCAGTNGMHPLARWDLRNLETHGGLGPKTARFFLLHSKPNQRLACLDTHILKYMREVMGVNAPKATPSGKRYAELEKQLLDHVDSLTLTMAEFDLTVWSKSAKV